MSGEIKQDGADSSSKSFDFQIYPADRGVTLTQALRSIYVNEAASTIISFQSTAFTEILTTDHELTFRANGRLTFTRVHRSSTYDPNKVYSGPTYGPPVTDSDTREATFLFQSNSKRSASNEKQDRNYWTASGVIPGVAFPELLDAVLATNWPAFAVEQQCNAARSVGKRVSIPACGEKLVEPLPRSDVQCTMPSTTGEDFGGEVCTGTPLLPVPQYPRTAHASGAGSRGFPPLELDVDLEMRLVPVNASRPCD